MLPVKLSVIIRYSRFPHPLLKYIMHAIFFGVYYIYDRFSH